MYDIVYTRIYVMKMGGKVGNPGRNYAPYFFNRYSIITGLSSSSKC